MAKHLVGPAEIAAALGVEANTINVWKKRAINFPKPVRRLKAGDLWDIREIEVWAHKTRRRFGSGLSGAAADSAPSVNAGELATETPELRKIEEPTSDTERATD